MDDWETGGVTHMSNAETEHLEKTRRVWWDRVDRRSM